MARKLRIQYPGAVYQVVDLNNAVPGDPIFQGDSATLNYFNNQTSAGVPIPGYNNDTRQYLNEMGTDLDLALLCPLG
jgi:hypothetical protein